jgi:hypothetical protein
MKCDKIRPMNSIHPGSSTWKSQIPFHPWVYFSIFLVSNTLLSYVPLSLVVKLWIGTIGIVLPILLGLISVLHKRRFSSPDSIISLRLLKKDLESLTPTLWLYLCLVLLVFFSRFWRLTHIPFWLLSDEGTYSILGIDLAQKWQWTVLWTQSREEPLLPWLLGFYFKLIEPSLTSIRFFPTLISLLTGMLAFWAASRFFSKFLSLIFTWLFVFSFWSFSLMRFLHPNDLILLFEMLAFGLLGLYLQSPDKTRKRIVFLMLSICVGIGFYAFVNWAVIWFYIFLVLFVHEIRKKTSEVKHLLTYSGISFLILIPLTLARLSPGSMSVIHSKFENFSLLNAYLSYTTAILWDSKASFPFGSNWGGIINPVTASFVMIGIIHITEKLELNLIFWIFSGWLLCMLPGTLTNSLELHRTTPALPFLILIATLGIRSLVLNASKVRPWFWIMPLLLISFAITNINFHGPYNDITRVPSEKQWRNVKYYNAYQILNRQRKQTGPVYLFSEFSMDYDNKTLNVACYPFDVLQNQKLDRKKANQTVLLVKMDYVRYLLSVFPGMNINILPNDASNGEVLQMGLFLIPADQINKKTLQAWVEADQVCREINLLIKNKNPVEPWSVFVGKFLENINTFKTDPFLRTVFWEKIAFFHYLNADYRKASEAYELAIRQGLEVAHLYQNDGLCLKLIGENQKAETAFKKARKISSR